LDANLSFPPAFKTVGQKIEYISKVLIPEGRFADYVFLMGQILDEQIHYVDPVHEFHHRDDVLRMLARYVPRAQNDKFKFDLIYDGEKEVIWRWTISLKIRFSPFTFVINGLVHAQVVGQKITYQREYYDPMESIGVIPFVGTLYKLILRFA